MFLSIATKGPDAAGLARSLGFSNGGGVLHTEDWTMMFPVFDEDRCNVVACDIGDTGINDPLRTIGRLAEHVTDSAYNTELKFIVEVLPVVTRSSDERMKVSLRSMGFDGVSAGDIGRRTLLVEHAPMSTTDGLRVLGLTLETRNNLRAVLRDVGEFMRQFDLRCGRGDGAALSRRTTLDCQRILFMAYANALRVGKAAPEAIAYIAGRITGVEQSIHELESSPTNGLG